MQQADRYKGQIMGRNRASRKLYSQLAGVITVHAVLLFCAAFAQAEVLNSCTTYCHGMPPRDAARKANPRFGSQSSAFIGNHKTHLPTAPVAADCNICHTPVTPTNFGHQNNTIRMANSLKGYSSATLRARYDKGVFRSEERRVGKEC